jgi:hypothetical protein
MLDKFASKDATFSDHSHDAPRRERPTAKAEEKEFVIRFVIRDQEAISIMDVILQSLPESASRVTVKHVSSAYPLVIVDDLWHCPVVLRDPVTDFYDVCRTRYAVAFLVCTIPRAVAAKNESPHDKKSGWKESFFRYAMGARPVSPICGNLFIGLVARAVG